MKCYSCLNLDFCLALYQKKSVYNFINMYCLFRIHALDCNHFLLCRILCLTFYLKQKNSKRHSIIGMMQLVNINPYDIVLVCIFFI